MYPDEGHWTRPVMDRDEAVQEPSELMDAPPAAGAAAA
jgi:hypothetical protein